MNAKRKRKPMPTGPLQRLHDAAHGAQVQSLIDVITPEMRAKGSYSEGRRIMNNHDPVARWRTAGKLTQSQEVAIEHVLRLWRLAGLEQRVTASYGERTSGGGTEHRAICEIEARQDLHRIQDYVPGPYWGVFENVCRHGMPAGIAGGDDRNGAHTAYVTVCFVADVIAMKERL